MTAMPMSLRDAFPNASTEPAWPAEPAELRQLRHHTRNALQAILAQVERDGALQPTVAGRRLREDLRRRIRLTAEIADALHGVATVPGPLGPRLLALAEATVGLLADPDQVIRVEPGLHVPAGWTPPGPVAEAVLRVAHEFLGNAVKHGMYARMCGHVVVGLEADGRHVTLRVGDDGWGWSLRSGAGPGTGEGLGIARGIAARFGGTVSLDRRCETTVATLVLPQAGTAVQ